MSLSTGVMQETQTITPCRKFEGHSKPLMDVIHLPGGQRIMTCSRDGSLRVWDLQSGKQIGNDWRDGESGVSTIALSPGGKKVVSGSRDGAMRLWDVDEGKVIARSTGHDSSISSVCWNRDGGRVVSGSYDHGTTRVWDVESGKTVLAIETGFSKLFAVIYSPDATMIGTGGHDKEYLKIWDAKIGKLVANLKGHSLGVECLAWTADGKTLISGSYDHSIRMWNTTTWQQITVLTGHTGNVWSIAISPNDRILASASGDSTARLWNLENGQPINLPLKHGNDVGRTSFSTDGKLLATGCADKNAYTWDVSAIVKEAGLGELLLNKNEKSAAGATRRQGDWRRNPYPGPSNNTLHHPHLSGGQIISSPSAHQQHISVHNSSHQHVPPGRISSLSRGDNDNAGGSPTQPHVLEWARNLFFITQNRQHDEGIELPEHHPIVVDVLPTRGKARNYSRREVEMKQEKEEKKRAAVKEKKKWKARDAKNAKNAKNSSAGSSRPSQSNVTQLPGEEAQIPSTPEPYPIGVPTSSTTSVIVVNSAGTAYWTRFWSAVCCISTQNADGDH